ncbi:MAG: presenilin family intramembrane aspartyl protease [Candidatus Caldarchaeum sp.]
MRRYLVAVLPVLTTLVFAMVFQSLLSGVMLPQPPLAPLQEEDEDVAVLGSPTPYLNSLIVIAVIFLGSLAMLWLIRYRRALAVIVSAVLFATAASVTFLFLFISTSLGEDVLLGVSVMVGGLVLAGVFSRREVFNVLAAAYVASASGVIFGISLPFWTSLVLLGAVAVYDVVAVFRGHLKRLGNMDMGELRGLVVTVEGLSIGLGDLFFYSVAQSFAASNLGWMSGMAASAGLIAGYLLTIKLAETRPVFPGLPLTLLVAMVCAFLITLIPL